MTYIASPSVQKYAGDKGVDLTKLSSETGRTRIAREDVDHYLSGNGAAPSSTKSAGANGAEYWRIDHSQYGPVREETTTRMARVAAQNLSAANAHIPQVTHHDRADMRAINALRDKWRVKAKDRNIKLTALAFHVKALARCLQDFPLFNSSLSPDGETLYFKDYVHIGVAVDTPQGLLVPVIRNADRKGLWDIAIEITDLANRAQTRKIRGEEMGGASMSISNLGGLGGTAFTPIVNPPEVAILGLTRTEDVPQWTGEDWVSVPYVPLDLSYDHRVINGADAARFLTRYAALIADPRQLLI